MFDHRHLRQFVGDQKRVRENRGVLAMQPMENLDRQFDFDAARHVNKSSRSNERFVQRRELRRAERRRLAMKWRRNKSSCSIRARSSGFKITPALREFLRKRIAPQQLIVGEDQPAGDFFEAESSVREFRGASASATVAPIL